MVFMCTVCKNIYGCYYNKRALFCSHDECRNKTECERRENMEADILSNAECLNCRDRRIKNANESKTHRTKG